MALPYVSGNWTFSSLHADSVTTPKQISVTNVSVPDEFTTSVTKINPNQKIDLDQALFYADHTGDGLTSPGNMTLGRKAVRNIYSATEVSASEQLPQKGGERGYVNWIMYFKVANSVSGAEYVIPVPLTFAATIPTWSAIPAAVLEDAVNHFLGLLSHGGTASVPYPALTSVFRGDLDLTR